MDPETVQPARRVASEKITLAVYLKGQESWTLELLASTNLTRLAKLLCDRAVAAVRPEDYEVGSHMWTFVVGQADDAGRTQWERSQYSSSFGDYAGPGDRDPAAARLETLRLSTSSRLRFDYDMGDTCRVALKVLRVAEPARNDGLPRWTPSGSGRNEVLRGTGEWRRLMDSVPAHGSLSLIHI